MKCPLLLLLIACTGSGFPTVTLAQVANDNIESRRLLQLEETVTSSTTNCTVQWQCVDERLTGKCIEYHNDQWFEFRPLVTGTYYVNIGRQKCRDVRGVQLVALLGTPCQPSSYRVLTCASLGTQDDLFVALPGLRAGQPVLLNVDGYLKDFCGFSLQVSHQARGLPAQPVAAPPNSPPAVSRIVKLTWRVPDSLRGAQQCRVVRREQHEFRSRELATIPLASSALGTHRGDYSLTDTLPGAGHYFYQVIAESGEDAPPVPVRQQWISYSQLRPIYPGDVGEGMAFLDLPLARYPRGAYLTILITRADNGAFLRRFALTNEPAHPQQGRVYAQPWLEAGIRQVAITIECRPARGPVRRDQVVMPVQSPAY